MVSFEPGIAQQIGVPGIDKLIEGINTIIDPNYQFKRAMQAQIAANPALGQHLADLEATAPGTLERMGFGKLGDIITKIPESAAGQVARETRGQQVDIGKAKTNLEQASTALDADKVAKITQALQNDPALAADFISRTLSGENVSQRQKTQAETREQTARADVLEAEKPGLEAKAKLDYENYSQTLKDLPQLQAMDPVNLIRDMINGVGDFTKLSEFASMPGGAAALATARTVLDAQEARDQREYFKLMAKQGTDAEERANIQAARQMLVSTKTGTLTAWRTVLEHPEQIDAIKAKDPTTLTQPERDVLHVAEAQQQQQNIIDEREVAGLRSAVAKGIQDVRISVEKGDNVAATGAVAEALNGPLAELGRYTGRQIKAVYGPKPDVGQTTPDKHTVFHPFTGSPPGLYFIDENGKRIADTEVFAPSRPNTIGGNLSADEARTLSVINSKNGQDKTTTIEWVKKNKPDIYTKIQSLIK